MFNTKIKNADGMFEDALYRSSHDNVTGIDIIRDMNDCLIKIVFTIQNAKRDRTVRDIQVIRNEEIKYYRPENITFRANKFASFMDEVPDYISEEQIGRWLELRKDKL